MNINRWLQVRNWGTLEEYPDECLIGYSPTQSRRFYNTFGGRRKNPGKIFDLIGNNMFYIKISNFLEVILSTAVVKIIPGWYDSRCLYAASVSELEILTEGRYNLRYSLTGVSEFVKVSHMDGSLYFKTSNTKPMGGNGHRTVPNKDTHLLHLLSW